MSASGTIPVKAADLKIDQTGLVFRLSGGKKCNDCKFDFDAQEPADDEEYEIPLMLFRGEGDATEMAVLCWPCAKLRMGDSFAA